MRILIDTHVLVWMLDAPARLSAGASSLIVDPANEIVVSAVTGWELATKHRIGKLPEAAAILAAFDATLQRLRATSLPMSLLHATSAGSLDWEHRDPFDRVLAAQSLIESIPLVTADSAFSTVPGLRIIPA